MANMTDWFGQQQKPNNNGMTISFKGDIVDQLIKLGNQQQGPVTNNMGAGVNIPGVLNQGAPTSTSLLGAMSPTANTGGGGMGPLMALAALSSGASLLGGNDQQQRFAPAISGGGGFSGKLINPYSRR